MPTLVRRIKAALRDPSLERDESLEVKWSAFMTMVLFLLVACIAGLASAGAMGNSSSWPTLLCSAVAVLSSLTAIARLFATRSLNPCIVGFWLVPTGVVILVGDWLSLGTSDIWTLVVLIMDCTLVFGAGRRAQLVLVTLTVAYLLTRCVQEAADVGIWGFVPGTEKFEQYVCPLKGLGLSLPSATYRVGTFLGDYLVTRSFASALVAQCEVMQLSQQVAATLAVLLSRYEVSEAQRIMESEECDKLPPELRAAFVDLLINLQSYKPYLPQHCLPDDLASNRPSGGTDAIDAAERSTATEDSDHTVSTEGIGECNPAAHEKMPHAATADVAALPIATSALRTPGANSSFFSVSMLRGGSSRSFRSGPGSGAILAVPVQQRVSCLCANRRGFLRYAAAQGASGVAELLQSEIDRFAARAAECKAVVDQLSGDHFRASLNAARPCITHRPSAVRCAAGFARGTEGSRTGTDPGACTVTSAVCSGTVICGDFGCTSIVRFMVIGELHNMLTATERFAAAWGVGVLMDGLTHSDVTDVWCCRLRGATVYPKLGGGEGYVWEAERERGRTRGSAGPAEWMYELANLGPDPWDPHAEAVLLWLCGDAAAAAQCAVSALAATAESEGKVRQALEELRSAVAAGAPPPRFTLSDAGVAGLDLALSPTSAMPCGAKGGGTPQGPQLDPRQQSRSEELIIQCVS
eukprot:TRINITY_DN4554_c0_g1_i1.p1 TRINITY_DN4554_c0_g1~~TRINITY_DN4554_c0_g1_i1.p1  ORF type:complete len:694 (+),score=169.07 TRINITY_DN4554_c0_g1_i1:103-2184(+)